MAQNDPLNLPEETNDLDIVFGRYDGKWFNEMLLKAKEVGITGRNSNTKWEKTFSDIIFDGGSIPYHSDWEETYIKKALRQFKAVASSFSSKHEDKTAVCAYMLKILEDGPQG